MDEQKRSFIKNFISPNDLMKNSKKTLSEITNELGITNTGTNSELIAKIWSERENENFERVLANYKNNIFSHRGSYVCYKLIKGSLNNVIKENFENLINKKVNINRKDITTDPQILSVYELSPDELIVKLTYRVRYENRIENEYIEKIPIIEQTNLLIDKKNEVIEIRSNYDTSRKIMKYIYNLDPTLDFTIKNINKDILIKSLNATMISSMGYTNNEQITLNKEAKDAVETIINLINSCLESETINLQYEEFQKQLEILQEAEEVSNFVLLLLSGLGKLDLGTIFDSGTKEDLTHNSLYQLVEPFIEANSIFLTIPFINNNVQEEFTIKVGLENNVITYVSIPTEELIRHVRSKLL